MTSKDLILQQLKESRTPLAVHELHIEGYSENNLATRLSELAREGKVIGRFRKGENFKEWSLATVHEPQFFEVNGQRCFQ